MKSETVGQQDETFREALRVVPVKNAKAVATPLPEDPERLEVEVTLEYRSAAARTLRRLLGAAKVKRYKLDRLGTAVYGMIDGRKTYEELADEFAAAQKLTFFEARALLGGFLRDLTKRGIVVAAVPKTAARVF